MLVSDLKPMASSPGNFFDIPGAVQVPDGENNIRC